MHIKQVIISGFRSFRNQNEIESFSPKHNVIVGRNGSGKSNFFDAIQFVLLGPRFAVLRQEDRQHLLHEGAGSSVMAAYVEIVFDNSDGRLSVESDEVILRRTVGHKKDEFFLNRKRIQKQEVMSLLESAGFSKSNPYYIVQQGKVSNLCVMKDADRLNLLKEVAGTTIYEERRAESLKIMQDTANKQEKVTEVLEFIEERLQELEQEKAELNEYERLDRQRRALEHSLYDKELAKSNDQLARLEANREVERTRQEKLYLDVRELQDALANEEDELAAGRAALERGAVKRAAKVAEVKETTARVSALEVEIQETDAALRANTREKEQLTSQLEEVRLLVENAQKELNAISPEFEQRTDSVRVMRQEMAALQRRVEALYGKQGRGAQFSSKAERNKFLQTQIDNIQKVIAGKQTELQLMSKEAAAEEKRLHMEQAQLQSAAQTNKLNSSRLEDVRKFIVDGTQQRNALQEKRKSAWRVCEEFQEQIQEMKGELEKSKQQLNRTLPKHISQGLNMVETIAAERGLTGYFGPVIDNISLKSDAFRTAVEVAAGSALFHVIVDTDATAALLMNELEQRKAGRLTFLPLNRLRNPTIDYPTSNDVKPLIEVAFDYDDSVAEAIKQVFGSKLLARDLNAAAQYSKSSGLDAITRDGDVVNRKGGFEGGYRDDRSSMIGAVFRIRECSEKLEELMARERALKVESESAESLLSDTVRELQKLESEKDFLAKNVEQVTRELAAGNKQLLVSTNSLAERRKGLDSLQGEIQESLEKVAEFKQEQSSPLLENLTAQEREEVRGLEDRGRVLRADLDDQQAQLVEVTAAKDKVSAELNGNLLQRREEIENRLENMQRAATIGSSSSSSSSRSSRKSDKNSGEKNSSSSEPSSSAVVTEATLASLLEDKQRVLDLLAVTEEELAGLEETVRHRTAELSVVESSLEEHRAEEKRVQEALREVTKALDKLLNKRSMLQDSVQTKQRAIRDLGMIPKKELDDFKSLSENRLLERMKDVNEQLKQYSSVNRKALDQYLSFNKQRTELFERQAQIAQDHSAIKQLIESLDSQKDEAILGTFRSVSTHFRDVFAELVPGGEGQLVMRTSLDDGTTAAGGSDEDGDGEGAESAASSGAAVTASSSALENAAISSFRGVQVRVCFSGAGQQYQMQQLSGGQKALVALALIFAIQRCDPAPFYLFDEIDQALDANYRAGVARLINKQAHSDTAPAQFITSTFRPELVNVADKCYGIALMNKVSNIHPLEQTDAQNFVTNLMLEEESAGQKITSVATFSRSERPSNASSIPGGGAAAAAGAVGTGHSQPTSEEKGLPRPPTQQANRRVSKKQRSSTNSRGSTASLGDEGDDDEEEEEEEEASGRRAAEYIEMDEEERRALEQLGLVDGDDDEEEDAEEDGF